MLDAARAVFLAQTMAHQGRIVDTAGDSVLAIFETAAGALNAALKIQVDLAAAQKELSVERLMQFRIGIHLGDVMEKTDGSVYGDGVNIAARLQALAEPGRITISDAIHGAVRGKAAASFSDRGEQNVKNIAHPVRMFDVTGNVATHPLAVAPIVATALSHGKPAIVVLPFRVHSDDRRLGFLADGLVEDVIALLARVPGFTLISHASSFAFRDHNGSAAEIARTLGVRYVVEGSMREAGDLVRVTAQLADAQSGQLLWSGRFEAEQGNASELQDDIVRGIITEIEPELTRAEIGLIRRLRPENLDAWAHYRLGIGAIAIKGWTEEAMQQARSQFRLAFEADPGFALARAHFALMTALGVNISLVPRTPADIVEAADQAERAIADDDGSSEVLGLAGCAFTDIGQRERGMEILERAVTMNPSNAQAHVAMGATLALMGDREAGIARMQHGMRISPRDRGLGFWGWAVGAFELRAGRIDEALQEARASAGRDPKLFLSRILEAACLVALSREAEAGRALAAARKLRPQLTLTEIAVSHGKRVAGSLAPLWMPSI
jgi:adenylate cyclase